jgi:hypothetical protein
MKNSMKFVYDYFCDNLNSLSTQKFGRKPETDEIEKIGGGNWMEQRDSQIRFDSFIHSFMTQRPALTNTS